MKKPLTFIVCILLAAGTAHATPSKLMHIPSTDVQPYGTFHLAIENNTTMFRQRDIGGHAEPANFGLSAGLLDAGTFQIEAGVDMREPYDYPLTFHAKAATTEEAFGKWGPILAIGIYDAGTDKFKNDINIVYGEASKTVSFIGRFSVGYFFGNSYFLKNPAGDADSHGLMLGFDRRMPEVNEKLWFGIDYMGTRSYYGAVTFGIGWSFSEKATLVIGYIRYNEEAIAKGWPPGDPATNARAGNLMTWQAHFDF
ncbi:MAG: hypothetical protein HZA03_03500 [Nitrospinae bacterium]|nr:hypothetical protein [Nitrospinota bacterium]